MHVPMAHISNSNHDRGFTKIRDISGSYIVRTQNILFITYLFYFKTPHRKKNASLFSFSQQKYLNMMSYRPTPFQCDLCQC